MRFTLKASPTFSKRTTEYFVSREKMFLFVSQIRHRKRQPSNSRGEPQSRQFLPSSVNVQMPKCVSSCTFMRVSIYTLLPPHFSGTFTIGTMAGFQNTFSSLGLIVPIDAEDPWFLMVSNEVVGAHYLSGLHPFFFMV